VPSGPGMTKGTLLANRNGAVVTSRLHPWAAPQIYVSAVVTTAFGVPLPALLSLLVEVENKESLIVSYDAHGLNCKPETAGHDYIAAALRDNNLCT